MPMKHTFLVFFAICFLLPMKLISQDTLIELHPVEISAQKYEITRLAPHSLQMDAGEISQRTPAKELPAILTELPGIHMSQGKGIGDMELRIRGFDVSNIQLLINGIPESSVDEGWIYWSNFTGIEDFAESVFVMKGISNHHPFSRAGGTISVNLVDAASDSLTRFSASYSNLSGNKIHFLHSSGPSRNGFSWALGGTWRYGSGYKDQTWFRGGNYFLNLSKTLGRKNLLQLTIIGCPQRHGQAAAYLPDSILRTKPITYNPSWGRLNGEAKQSAINFYHRTLIQLKHVALLNRRTKWVSTLNFSQGRGGGTANFGNTLPMNDQIDFDAAVTANQANYDSIHGGTNALYFLGDYCHQDAGLYLFSEVNYQLSPSSQLKIGILGNSSLYVNDFGRINDLLGADFQAYAGETDVRTTGDKIWYNSESSRYGAGVYAAWEKTSKWLTYALSGAFMESTGSVTNLFNVPDSAVQRSDMKWYSSYNLKGSTLFSASEKLGIYLTAGFQHRHPPIQFIGNTVIDNIHPEKFYTAEVGVRYTFDKPFQGELHGDIYYTGRYNQTFVRNYTDGLSGETFAYSVRGIDSRHYGAELEFSARYRENFAGRLSVSYNPMMWLNNVESTVTDKAGISIDTIRMNAKGLINGEQPQFTLFISGLYTLKKHYQFFAEARYCGVNYSWFNISSYADAEKAVQSWRYPDYVIADLGVAYKTMIAHRVLMNVAVTLHNVFNTRYISESLDGWNHDPATSTVIYGHGRCLTAAITLSR